MLLAGRGQGPDGRSLRRRYQLLVLSERPFLLLRLLAYFLSPPSLYGFLRTEQARMHPYKVDRDTRVLDLFRAALSLLLSSRSALGDKSARRKRGVKKNIYTTATECLYGSTPPSGAPPFSCERDMTSSSVCVTVFSWMHSNGTDSLTVDRSFRWRGTL